MSASTGRAAETLVVEILGTGTHNRGAELMADAIASRLRELTADVTLAVDRRFGTFEDRGRYGLRVTDNFPIRSLSRLCATMAPPPLRACVGLVRRSDVDVLLDASGFAFSDEWGVGPAKWLLREVVRRRRRGQKLIFLPQAFGPFEKPDVARTCKELFSHASLIYARDQASYAAVQALSTGTTLRLCPDFTMALHARTPEASLPERFAAVVPNIRMVDKTADRNGLAYLAFLKAAVECFRDAGVTPVVVLHDAAEDRRLLPMLFAETGTLPVLESREPRELKGLLGRAHIVCGSRFHALVSALSQGVPSIGTGWSHKYRWLFEDFGCAENVLDLTDKDALRQAVVRMTTPHDRQALTRRLQQRAERLTEQVDDMWREVATLIGIEQRAAPQPAQAAISQAHLVEK